jgi:Xaa-Pro aminopeptidase
LGQVETLVKPLKVKTCNVNMQELRKVKTKEELVLLQKAADIAVATVEYVRKNIKVGMSEKEVAKMIYINMIKLGASGLSFDSIIAFGENSAIPHHAPNDRTLKKNEFITVDIGCIYKGYCSDITRTFVLGKPTQRMIDMYNLVFKAQAAGVNKIKAGMKGCDIDNICRTIISNNQT